MSADALKKRRARRIASDEAHAWARSLPLGNPFAKSVLRALSLYVNGEGCCFVSLEQLAEDTDLSLDTVRRRVVWLDQVGAIARIPQWLDEHGRRVSSGKGRRTTDEIRLMIDVDIDEIETAVKGRSDANSSTETTQISPSRPLGQNEAAQEGVGSSSPALAIGQPLHSGEGLISEPEPEPEVSPLPPSGGSEAVDDGWKEFERDWEGPILRQSIARDVWAALTPQNRKTAHLAARGYFAWRKTQRKPPNVINAHTFLREEHAWPRFAKMATGSPVEGATHKLAIGTLELKAVEVLHSVAGKCPLPDFMRSSDGAIYYRKDVLPQLLALANASPKADWPQLTRQQAGAWNGFLVEFMTLAAWSRLGEGSRAPWPWPPKKDGSLYTGPPPDIGCDDAELADFGNAKIGTGTS